MFDPLFDLIAILLAWFYSVWPSYGVAIAMLTFTVMVVSTPFTLKGIRSMLHMQEYSAELKKIQNEHRGDRQAMNEATMAFYKEHGINPMGSCLPMLIQAPVFLVLYQVVRGLTRRTTEIGTQLGHTSLRYGDGVGDGTPVYSGTPIRRGELTFDPDFLSRDTDLYASLSDSREMVSWGIDLSRTASAAMAEGIVEALPYLVMLILVFVTGLYQQHQIQRRQKGSMINKQQQMIMKIIPYFLPVVSYSIPAAVVVYFIVSALYRIVQQAYITKSYYTGEDSLGARAAKQREAAVAEGSAKKSAGPAKAKSTSKSETERKGGPTPKRDAKTSRGKAPVRQQRAGRSGPSSRADSTSAASRRGRTGKAPSRSRSGSSRNRSQGGRTTPSGSRASRGTPNRSKSKKKRR